MGFRSDQTSLNILRETGAQKYLDVKSTSFQRVCKQKESLKPWGWIVRREVRAGVRRRSREYLPERALIYERPAFLCIDDSVFNRVLGEAQLSAPVLIANVYRFPESRGTKFPGPTRLRDEYAGGIRSHALLTDVQDARILIRGRRRDTRFVHGASTPVRTSTTEVVAAMMVTTTTKDTSLPKFQIIREEVGERKESRLILRPLPTQHA
jgi:hypothetical protein